jgi:flavodoxin
MKSLVVYYSRTGKTKFAAETIAAQLSADIEEIVDQKKRAGPIGWLNAGKAATREETTKIASLKYLPANYDLIVLGTPVWAWRPTPAIRTYIKQTDLTAKKVAFFLTSDGDPKQAAERTKALFSNSIFTGELSLISPLKDKESTEKRITEWCDILKQ